MFPDPAGMRRRLTAKLDKVAATVQFRIAVSAVLVCLHLVAFTWAGRDRLDLPFNSAPGEAPYYSDPDAPSVQGYPRQPHYWSRLLVSRWDAQIYIGFAERGLTSCPSEPTPAVYGDNAYLQCGLGWMPAFGLAGGVVERSVTCFKGGTSPISVTRRGIY